MFIIDSYIFSKFNILRIIISHVLSGLLYQLSFRPPPPKKSSLPDKEKAKDKSESGKTVKDENGNSYSYDENGYVNRTYNKDGNNTKMTTRTPDGTERQETGIRKSQKRNRIFAGLNTTRDKT